MYCPVCRAEYREGFSECADCGVALVEQLPPDRGPEPSEPGEVSYQDLAEVFTTTNLSDIPVVKSVLEAQEIHYVVQGEDFAHFRAPVPIRVLVPISEREAALHALRHLL